MCAECEERMEEGRVLASWRDALVVKGFDPSELAVPIAPEYCRNIQDQH